MLNDKLLAVSTKRRVSRRSPLTKTNIVGGSTLAEAGSAAPGISMTRGLCARGSGLRELQMGT